MIDLVVYLHVAEAGEVRAPISIPSHSLLLKKSTIDGLSCLSVLCRYREGVCSRRRTHLLTLSVSVSLGR